MEENKKGKAEKFFREFGQRLDQFMVEAKDASQRMEAEMKMKFEELKAAAEKVKKEAENKERWKEVEEGLKRAASELEKTFKTAFKKRDSN
jgi:uncharacterized membrane protein YfbV (UPF0208 family)